MATLPSRASEPDDQPTYGTKPYDSDDSIPESQYEKEDLMTDTTGVTSLLAGSALFGNRDGYGRNDSNLADLIQAQGLHSGHANIQSNVADAARDVTDAINNVGNLNLQSSERNGGETRRAVDQAASIVKDQAAANANQAARDFANQNREICEIRSELAQESAATRLKSTEQHASIQLEACKNQALLAAQIAECCCETKELIRSENAATRQLLQGNLVDDANRRTAAVERELLLAQIQASGGNGGGRS